MLGGVSVKQQMTNTKYQPPFLLGEDNFQSQILERGRSEKKISA